MVMLDVVIALLPLVVAGYMAYGMHAITLTLVSIVSALVTELIFSSLYLKNYRTILDGSAVVTALLMVFTLSPATPWYMVSFGAAAAILFGKIVWGGLGKNRFNPALVGREFMTCFFPAVMTSAVVWKTSYLTHIKATDLFPGISSAYVSSYFSGLFYKTSGALGECSILLLVLGGLYLLIRKRISWHIPLALLAVLFAAFWFVEDGDDLHFSVAGVLLGTIYMATDMPSSPTNPYGKLFYGAMIGLVTFILILGGVKHEYMSFSILILNGFSRKISETFAPRVWGNPLNWKERTENVFMLSLSIMAVALAVVSLHYYHFTQYLVYLYIIYIVIKFNYSFIKKISNPI